MLRYRTIYSLLKCSDPHGSTNFGGKQKGPIGDKKLCINVKTEQEKNELPIFQYATEKTKRAIRVYNWGHALPGCLGFPDYVRPPKGKFVQRTQHKPTRLTFADKHKINNVACGHGFTVFASSSSSEKLFGTGLNYDSQIGYQAPQKGRPLVVLLQPVPIQLPCSPKAKVIDIACGRTHTVVLTDEGIFSLGNNAFGQCGYKVIEDEIYHGKMKINKIQDLVNIVKVFCGQDHTIFLNSEGKIYSCGWGADGQTGLGNYEDQGFPKEVEGDIKGEKIIHVSGVSDTVLAVSDRGDVFGWGNSEYGQLKVATNAEQLCVPRHLPMNHVGKVVHAASAGTMCAVVNDKGQVYVWGYGILGQGPQVSHLYEPTLLPEPLFGKNEFNPDSSVISITCGLYFFAAITNQGHLYTWGKNKNACLGLGDDRDQFFPYRASVPAEVLKVSCGVDHVTVLCRAFC